MKITAIIGLLLCFSLSGFSQTNTQQTQDEANMEKIHILGLRTTIYKVGDMEKAKKWYAAAFDKAPYWDEPFYVGFNIGGYELGLQPAASSDTIKARGVISYWGVADIHKAYSHFIESGAIENEKPFSVGGPLMVASVKDPWGNVIGLIYNPEFKLQDQ